MLQIIVFIVSNDGTKCTAKFYQASLMFAITEPNFREEHRKVLHFAWLYSQRLDMHKNLSGTTTLAYFATDDE
jgi:hypothetical protein